MRDVLGWRAKFGVLGPSTNTIVQPDFEMMRPPGVTNHYSRIFTPNAQAVSNETFMAGNERYGRPSNPDFLLRPGELLEAFGTLTVVAFEQGTVERPKKAALQRICVIREPAGSVRIRA